MSTVPTPVSGGSALGRLLLGADSTQRVRVSHSLVSARMYVVCSVLMFASAYHGYAGWPQAWLMSGLMLGSGTVFYLLLRSGRGERFRDPSLTLAQILVGITLAAGCYATTPVSHPATLVTFVLVLMFGVFNLQRGQAVAAAWYTVAAIGAAVAWGVTQDPSNYPWPFELLNLFLAALFAPVIALESARLAAERMASTAANDQLSVALLEIDRLAAHDGLTGLINRRRMMERIDQAMARQPKGVPGPCVAMLDLDHFKLVNDEHGHAAGDAVLKGFAATALASIRACDVLGRWGGEEFLLLFDGSTPAQAEAALERLRTAFAAVTLVPGRPDVNVTFSAGLSACRGESNVEPVIVRADQALYAAKALGRNRTVAVR